jgi:hypothetical protein
MAGNISGVHLADPSGTKLNNAHHEASLDHA